MGQNSTFLTSIKVIYIGFQLLYSSLRQREKMPVFVANFRHHDDVRTSDGGTLFLNINFKGFLSLTRKQNNLNVRHKWIDCWCIIKEASHIMKHLWPFKLVYIMWYAPEKLMLTSATASVNINFFAAHHMYTSWDVHDWLILTGLFSLNATLTSG